MVREESALSSRRRVADALAHKQTDRVPMDLGGTLWTGLAGVAYANLRKALGLPTRIVKLNNVPCQLAELDDDVCQALGVDIQAVREPIPGWQKDVLTDGTECLIGEEHNIRTLEDGTRAACDAQGNVGSVMPPGGFYFDKPPGWRASLAQATTVKEVEKIPAFQIPVGEFDRQAVREQARHLWEQTDYFVTFDFYTSIFEKTWEYRGMAEFLMDLACEEKIADCLLEQILQREIEVMGPKLESCKGYVQAITVSDDMATQTGLMFSPQAYRRFIKPRQKRLYEFMKSICDVPLLLHSCGNVYDLIPDLIEIGVDALNPVQVACPDMADTGRLKREFGKDMVFWGGGCDTQKILPTGSPHQVREEVRRRVGDLSAGGGFIFAAVHDIQADTPPENIIAMFEAAREFGP